MPYKIIKRKGGFFVKNVDTGKEYSSRPMTKMDAEAQKRILEAVDSAYKGMKDRKK